MSYQPAEDRYSKMIYRRCGRSGLNLPAVSLGLWHNFGHDTPHEMKQAMCRAAFDHGITHFDLANNYGPPPGRAEEAFGDILKTDFNFRVGDYKHSNVLWYLPNERRGITMMKPEDY